MSDASILAQVQAVVDIATANPAYVSSLISACKDFVAAKANLPVYSTATSQGYSKGGAAPSTNLSALASAGLWLSIDGSPWTAVGLTLASCTSGAATAAHLQAQIRALGDAAGRWQPSFLLASVSYDAADFFYQITSPKFGRRSKVYVHYDPLAPHVAQAMKLGLDFGGVEISGLESSVSLDRAVAQLAINAYRETLNLPQAYERGASFIQTRSFQRIDKQILDLIKSARGLGVGGLDSLRAAPALGGLPYGLS